ncbi:MAG: BlaI/MecI/CopY family transcriptional regulator [Paramuribaculum sp.]|nr:BlaI/MecI/CopY family transcriptional regulator [Paramuribaculum sp.]
MNQKKKLTEKESAIMKLLWEHGAMFVREMLTYYDEPRPHFNTVSTTVRILEDKGFVTHEAVGSSYRYKATVSPEYFRSRTLSQVVRDYFSNSYTQAVSSLVEEEKVSVDELREIIAIIERRKNQS